MAHGVFDGGEELGVGDGVGHVGATASLSFLVDVYVVSNEQFFSMCKTIEIDS